MSANGAARSGYANAFAYDRRSADDTGVWSNTIGGQPSCRRGLTVCVRLRNTPDGPCR